MERSLVFFSKARTWALREPTKDWEGGGGGAGENPPRRGVLGEAPMRRMADMCGFMKRT